MTTRSVYLALGALFCVATQPACSAHASTDLTLAPMGHSFFCLKYPDDCRPTRASNVPAHLQQLRSVNTAVNRAITPQVDDSGPADRNWNIWPSAGDCDDYAVTKRHELLKMGWPSSKLLLAEVTLIATGEHHLVLIVRGETTDWILDNLRTDVVRFADIRDAYIWDRRETAENPRFWTRSFEGLRRS